MTDTLERDLAAALRGEVRFSDGDRALYAADSSNYRRVPRGVVIPRDIDDMVKAIELCARHGISITHRGGGTSLAGQTTGEGVVIARNGTPIAELTPLRRPDFVFGRFATVLGPEAGDVFLEPLTDAELADWEASPLEPRP